MSEIIIPQKYNIIQKPMAITFDKGFKIITHPSGVISKYDRVDIQRHKDELLKERQRIEGMLIKIEDDISKV